MCVYLQHATCLEFFVSNFDTDQGLWAEVFCHTKILIWNFRAFPNYLENGHNIMLKLILRIYLNEWESIEENVMNMVAWPFLKMLTGVQTFHFKRWWWWWWWSSSSSSSMIINAHDDDDHHHHHLSWKCLLMSKLFTLSVNGLKPMKLKLGCKRFGKRTSCNLQNRIGFLKKSRDQVDDIFDQ